MRLVKRVKPQDPSTPMSSTPHVSERNYAAKLAKSLRALVSAADIITTIRIDQSNDYNSPTDYGRTLTCLFDALLGVTFAPSADTTLEIYDCPLMSLRESGLFLDEEVIKKVVAKFSQISLHNYFREYFITYQVTKWTQLGQQLVDGLRASGDHLTGLSLRGTPYWIPNRLIISEDNYPSLTHITLFSI